MITEGGSLLTTHCYLTCSMITEVRSLLTTPCYLTCTNESRGRLSAHHTLLPYMHPVNLNLQTFNFVDPPEVHLVSDKVATDMNSSAILTCRSRAVPLPTFEWYNGTNRLSTGGRIAISESIKSGIYNHQSVLNITEVYPTDLGQYGCRVINMLGETTSNIYLTVKSMAIYVTVSFCVFLYFHNFSHVLVPDLDLFGFNVTL